MSSANDLAGRVAVVVGAGSGLGRDLASALAEHGAKVVLAGRTRENLEATFRMLPAVSSGRRAGCPHRCEQAEDVDSLHEATEQRFGSADILINSAGIFGPLRPLTRSDPDEWIQTLSINCVGPYLTCRAFAPGMVDQGWGRIVNVSSAAPLYPPAAVNSAYGTSKAALNQMTRHLAVGARWHRGHRQRHASGLPQDRDVG